MKAALAPPADGRNETALERCDRNLTELMQEIRVAQTGVQVLLGFLLMVPFTARFSVASPFQRGIYVATVVAAAAAALLLIAPTSHHRLLFRCGDKERLVMVANRYANVGLLAVAAAMVGAVWLVADVVLGSSAAAGIAAAAAGLVAWSWYVEPLRRRQALVRRLARARQTRQAPLGLRGAGDLR